jgi:hypothetical protein
MATVYQKRGVWYVGYKDGTGRRRLVRTSAVTKTEAKLLAHDLEHAGERQRRGLEPLPDQSNLNLGELCEWGLKNRCSAASLYVERKRLERHIIKSSLGRTPLRTVTPALIDTRLREIEAGGAAAGTINNIRKVLRTVYAQARKAGRFSGANPVDDVACRRVPRRYGPLFGSTRSKRSLRLWRQSSRMESSGDPCSPRRSSPLCEKESSSHCANRTSTSMPAR